MKRKDYDPNNPLSLCGEHLRVRVGGRVMTTRITDYIASSRNYDGIAETCRSLDVGDNVNFGLDLGTKQVLQTPITRVVHGITVYDPANDRPDRDFQGVFPGEDESPLDRIGQKNADESVFVKPPIRTPPGGTGYPEPFPGAVDESDSPMPIQQETEEEKAARKKAGREERQKKG